MVLNKGAGGWPSRFNKA